MAPRKREFTGMGSRSIAFAEELGRMLARREFARIEQSAEHRHRDEQNDHGQSRDLCALLVRPAEPSLD